MKLFIILGALNGFIAVALGAFGAHGLEGKIPDKYLETWQTAVQYQMFHAVGLLVLGLLAGKIDSPLINWSGWLMLIGIILFSGSLFVLSVTQIKVLGAITPLGGVSFLVAWILMIIAAYKYL
ncbi:DUF423 domain-containing protein [Peribacillus frigoritolerans]|uniref:DUF423 domain-containing protein n=1 Tax=Peribacillus frigoritolerans TaxID=450367 RepID=UPI00207AB867|nr:DUF423 domain-containing protein [Peribacillus frigoritolerans]USK80351.1 DUF423 domain-containing protein [Peribacillus frigoritolerans]WJE47619.1 DUF423 domain-containing protein [Peribacillus frigoritolerans]